MRKSLSVLTALVIAGAAQVWAVGEARITGKVVDQNDQPIAGAEILVESAGSRPYSQTYTSNEDGNYSIFLLDGTQQYKFTVSKDGYATFSEVIKLKLNPERNEREFKLMDPTQVAVAAQAEADPAVLLYNDGVKLANADQDVEAIAKMEEALTVNPALSAAKQALIQLYHRTGNWAGTIRYGEEMLELLGDDANILVMVADAHEKSGNKEKAAAYRDRAPKNASALFNDAAQLINSGRMAEAEPLLVQAIAADPQFAKAYYELGMLYAGMGRNPEAKTNLQKYLEIEPEGSDAPTAREMLSYVD